MANTRRRRCRSISQKALEVGYRHIDTAQGYKNEASVGQAIKESGIPREELFFDYKLWNANHSYDLVMSSFEESLEKLQTDYIDLFLIHWPNPVAFRDNWQTANAETWRAFEELYQAGKIKAIGVSNFLPHHFEELKNSDYLPNGQSNFPCTWRVTRRSRDLLPRTRCIA